jgi:hypothetical protein
MAIYSVILCEIERYFEVRQDRFFKYNAVCSPLKVNRRFGGTCRRHLQGQRISKARNQHEAEEYVASIFRVDPEYGSDMFLLNVA